MSLRELYTGAILRHNRTPHNFGEIADADITAKGYNKACGDDMRIFVRLEDEVVKEVTFLGRGCAVSQSSASMMTDRMKGKSLSDALEFVEEFKKMIHGEKEFSDTEDFKELSSLRGVLQYPVRAKCASLAWDTLELGVAEYRGRKNGQEL